LRDAEQRIQGAHESADIGVVADEAFVLIDPERVHRTGACGERRDFIARNAHPFLVRHRHVSPSVLRQQCGERAAEIRWFDVYCFVPQRNTRRAEGGVLEDRRE
jgi:hypothetical protein